MWHFFDVALDILAPFVWFYFGIRWAYFEEPLPELFVIMMLTTTILRSLNKMFKRLGWV